MLPLTPRTAAYDRGSDFPQAALWRLASGLEAGVIGGLAMLLLLVAGSMWSGDVWWAPANLLASTFYGRRAFRVGPGMATLSGVALHIVITGIVGALFGLACGGVRERRRLVVLGSLAGVFWYYLADAMFWAHVNPLVPAYAPQPVTLLAHALFGACLGYMGQNLGGRTPVLERFELSHHSPRHDSGHESGHEPGGGPVPAIHPVVHTEPHPDSSSTMASAAASGTASGAGITSATEPPPLPGVEPAPSGPNRSEQDRMEIG